MGDRAPPCSRCSAIAAAARRTPVSRFDDDGAADSFAVTGDFAFHLETPLFSFQLAAWARPNSAISRDEWAKTGEDTLFGGRPAFLSEVQAEGRSGAQIA